MIQIEMQGDRAIEVDLAAGPGHVTRAMVRASNRAMAAARTVLARAIAGELGMKVGDVRDRHLKLSQASVSHPRARLAASLKRIPLVQFDARGPEPSRGRGRGVSYRLGRGRNRHPSAFLATMRSGHRGVFVRVGGKGRSSGAWSKNLPIVEQRGPSIGKIFARYRPLGLARAWEAFRQNFDHELAFQKARPDAGTD